jgi:hypothetical protein
MIASAFFVDQAFEATEASEDSQSIHLNMLSRPRHNHACFLDLTGVEASDYRGY